MNKFLSVLFFVCAVVFAATWTPSINPKSITVRDGGYNGVYTPESAWTTKKFVKDNAGGTGTYNDADNAHTGRLSDSNHVYYFANQHGDSSWVYFIGPHGGHVWYLGDSAILSSTSYIGAKVLDSLLATRYYVTRGLGSKLDTNGVAANSKLLQGKDTTALQNFSQLAIDSCSSGAATLNLAYKKHRVKLNSGTNTLTLTAPTVGGSNLLNLIQPSTGAAGTVSWPSSVKWIGGSAPTLPTANDSSYVVALFYGGATYKGSGEGTGGGSGIDQQARDTGTAALRFAERDSARIDGKQDSGSYGSPYDSALVAASAYNVISVGESLPMSVNGDTVGWMYVNAAGDTLWKHMLIPAITVGPYMSYQVLDTFNQKDTVNLDLGNRFFGVLPATRCSLWLRNGIPGQSVQIATRMRDTGAVCHPVIVNMGWQGKTVVVDTTGVGGYNIYAISVIDTTPGNRAYFGAMGQNFGAP